LRPLATLHQPWHAIATGAPQTPALPSGIRIVDARIETLGKKTDRVRDSQHHHLPVLQGNEAVIKIGSGDRDILAETDRVVVIDPCPVARLGARIFEAFKPRARIFVEGKAFRTVIAGRARPVERVLAFAAVETDEASV